MTQHDPIPLTDNDSEVAKWVWKHLVPKSGQSFTVQGELLRAVEKLRWEAQNNGNINWDDGFVMFIDYLRDHLTSEAGFSTEEKAEIEEDLDRLRNFLPVEQLTDDSHATGLPYVEDDLYDRLVSRVIGYCRLHPQPTPREREERQWR